MSDEINNADHVEPQGDKPKVVQYISGAVGEDQGDHTNCHPKSPCHDPDVAIVSAVGIRAVVVDGDKYLNRDDVLVMLARTYNGYMEVHHAMHGMDDRESVAAAMSTFISGQTVNLIGAQLHELTDGDGMDVNAPDTVPTDWLSDQPSSPAPESPIETAIRKAKEAALAALGIEKKGEGK